ncbi:MAG TPA: nucleoside deaminase [Cellulomonas sp.]|uniref:nucleoside deaminase n=1 Tax=Cellulomonas sp. TaxID=40001 RepID=UPI002E31D809|nr:nucleoside deaminase [Cellulomonas sp.]HEX5331282.1 nucleoside deaminase [Cellulomonas sp.]
MTSSMAQVDPTAAPPEEDQWLVRAVRLALQNVADGGGPFGAVVVRGGVVVGTGQNRVTRDNDPTAHAEVTAIRDACARLGDFSLVGARLYSSCEPCPLCLTAALWARLDRVVYAANRDDAARAGFDDRAFYDLLRRDRAAWPMPVVERRIAGAEAPIEAWLAFAERVEY